MTPFVGPLVQWDGTGGGGSGWKDAAENWMGLSCKGKPRKRSASQCQEARRLVVKALSLSEKLTVPRAQNFTGWGAANVS